MTIAEILAWIEGAALGVGVPLTLAHMKNKDKKHERNLQFERDKMQSKHEKAEELEERVILLEKQLDTALSMNEVTQMQWAALRDVLHVMEPTVDDLCEQHPSMSKPLKKTITRLKKMVDLDTSHLNDVTYEKR